MRLRCTLMTGRNVCFLSYIRRSTKPPERINFHVLALENVLRSHRSVAHWAIDSCTKTHSWQAIHKHSAGNWSLYMGIYKETSKSDLPIATSMAAGILDCKSLKCQDPSVKLGVMVFAWKCCPGEQTWHCPSLLCLLLAASFARLLPSIQPAHPVILPLSDLARETGTKKRDWKTKLAKKRILPGRPFWHCSSPRIWSAEACFSFNWVHRPQSQSKYSNSVGVTPCRATWPLMYHCMYWNTLSKYANL